MPIDGGLTGFCQLQFTQLFDCTSGDLLDAFALQVLIEPVENGGDRWIIVSALLGEPALLGIFPAVGRMLA